MKDTFSHSRIFREIRLDHLIILFSLIELELKVESGATSPSSTMSETLFRFEHTLEQSF